MICNSCQKSFPDYKELAKHIMLNKKGHKQGRVWAAKFLSKINILDRKPLHGKVELTEEDKENKLSTIRQISGENELVLAMCPKCRKGHRELLPVEFTRSSQAWRTGKALMVMCQDCK